MPLETPFHKRTQALCTSYRWKEWAGYHAVCSYDVHHDREYTAVRHSAGLLDVTPLFKLEVTGPDAADFLAYVWTRDVTRMAVGQVTYGSFCDEAGKVLDDGTLTRFEENRFRMTSAEPAYAWLYRHSRGFDVELEDVTDSVAALALQGPTSKEILAALCGSEVRELGYFRALETRIKRKKVEITRTGYTGDLGYELWMPNSQALGVYDALMEAGEVHGIVPLGLDALDVTRIEAGFMLGGVDYTSARCALIEDQKSTPYELGLGWAVHTDRAPFIGQEALVRERSEGPKFALVGLEIDWAETEKLYESFGLPPALPMSAWRTGVPVYDGLTQVGRATSGAWSPTLKKNLALATVPARYASPRTELKLEVTVEYRRKKVKATVSDRPFFDPERKKA